jgi:hypothetical protein
MAPAYTSKGERRFRYYVCRRGRENSGCVGKRIAACVIEESVIEQVRSALSVEEAREQLHVSETEWQAFAENQSGEFIRTIVRRAVYDGTQGAVSLELGR